MPARLDDGSESRMCVDIHGSDEYDQYRDDETVCLHFVEGVYDAVHGTAHVDSVFAAVAIGSVAGDTRIGSVRGAAVIATLAGNGPT